MKTRLLPRTIIDTEPSYQIVPGVYRLVTTNELIIIDGDAFEALAVFVKDTPNSIKEDL